MAVSYTHLQGFEEVNVPDSFFDGVIGNVPFGDFKVTDKRYDKYNFLIHDYFFAKLCFFTFIAISLIHPYISPESAYAMSFHLPLYPL